MSVVVIVGHAPHSGHDREERQTYFMEVEKLTDDLVNQFPDSKPFVCIDANARVGSHRSAGIGKAEPEEETESGEMLRGMLSRLDMAATNTFKPAGWTWESSRRTRSRIDYVCCSLPLLDSLGECYAGGDLDLTLDHSSDHRAVASTFKVEPDKAVERKARRARGINKMNLKCPWRAAFFQNLVWQFWADPAWTTSEHEQHLSHYVRESALKHFWMCEWGNRPRVGYLPSHGASLNWWRR